MFPSKTQCNWYVVGFIPVGTSCRMRAPSVQIFLKLGLFSPVFKVSVQSQCSSIRETEREHAEWRNEVTERRDHDQHIENRFDHPPLNCSAKTTEQRSVCGSSPYDLVSRFSFILSSVQCEANC